MIIAGAGLAGLIAAHAFPTATIVEQAPERLASHQALLRFRTDEVSRLTGVPFKSVLVRKGIWYKGAFCCPDIHLANLYSQKVTGKLLPRSVWEVDPVTRFIAPPDLYDRLLANVGHRITWGQSIDVTGDAPVISTIPLHAMAELCGMPMAIDFDRAPITVRRYRIKNASVHQTVYFPGGETSVYRASITDDTLIMESMSDSITGLNRGVVFMVFGLNNAADIELIGQAQQRYGKIAPIDEALRREALYRLTRDHQVYSVGRFATWRNILLDDVVKDLRIVKGMIEQADAYSTRLRSL